MVQHDSLVSYVETAIDNYGVGPGERVLQFCSISFDTSMEEIYPCLAGGGTLVLRTEWMIESVPTFLRACQDWRISLLSLPTAYWHEIAANLATEVAELPPSIRLIIIGGERALPERLARWRQRVGRRTRLINTYGLTESTIVSTLAEITSATSEEDDSSEISIGRAIRNTQVYVLDHNLKPAPAGSPGEIYIGGLLLARGYFNRPDLTAQKFIPDPFGDRPGARIYSTGDVAHILEGGDLEFHGRADHQIKLAGFRVELGEIELNLMRHPKVREAVVVAHEDSASSKYLAAYVVLEDGQKLAPGELRNFLRESLAQYMVPAIYMTLESLPLTTTGKVDRLSLPTPDRARADLEEEFVGPRNEVEAKIAAICEEVLGLHKVGVYDKFLDMGGDSLRVIQLISRIRQAFDVEMPFSRIFKNPTIADLAHSVSSGKSMGGGLDLQPIQPVPRDGPLPVTFPQEAIWLLSELTDQTLAYNTQLCVRFKGDLRVEILNKAFTEIVRRHEIFRTTFFAQAGQLFQRVHEPWPVNIPVVDLLALPEQRRCEEAESLTGEICGRPFDTKQIPLIRWVLLRLDREDHILVQVEHHFVHDGWSLTVLLREMSVLYAAFVEGRPSPLSELTIQFADFAAWQRKRMQGGVLDGLLGFWKGKLAHAPAISELPVDHPRPKNQTFHGAVRMVEFSADVCEALAEFGRKHNATMFMTMIATFYPLLYRYTGQEDIVIGSSVANRLLRESENLIGMIVNTIVLRAEMYSNPTFLEFLKRVRESTLEAFTHQDIPFEKLVNEIQPKRDASRNPLFQIMFSFHDSAMPRIELPGLHSELRYRHNGSAKFDLNIVVLPRFEQSSGQIHEGKFKSMSMEWEYNTDLFEPDTIRRLVSHYEQLLTSVLENPDRRLADLPMLTESERRELVGGPAASPSNGASAIPHNPAEETIINVWKELSGTQDVSIHENLLDSGDANLTAQLVSRLRDIFEVDLSSDMLLQAPTVMELAVVINGLSASLEEERKLSVLKMLEEIIGDDMDEELSKTALLD
jgi:non-ribosomal peptide synthetase component F/acyl carrier protein